MRIYHITDRPAWDAARAAGAYVAPSLVSEGFIHFSHAHQVVATANRFYQGRADLVVLAVETDRLRAELREERAADGAGVFPHLYGALNLDAVVDTLELAPSDDGTFVDSHNKIV